MRRNELTRRFDVVLLDFYGTVVHEDDVVIAGICEEVSRSSPWAPRPAVVAKYWWEAFSARTDQSNGDSFQPQRVLEHASLVATIDHFGAECDPDALSDRLYAHWERPPIYEDARSFLDRLQLPVIVVSNIDRHDIESAIDHHGLSFDAVITSEDVRAYKPRPEIFLAAARAAGAPLDRTLHVGDSVSSDIAGAHALGIPVAWVNRGRRTLPAGLHAEVEVSTLTALLGDAPSSTRGRGMSRD